MKFLEKNLEDILWETEKSLLYLRGIDEFVYNQNVKTKYLRQKRIGNYGICDILKIEFISKHTIQFTVFELKKDIVNIGTFLQAIKYVKGIKRYFEFTNRNYEINFDICLIGNSIDFTIEFIYLTDILKYGINLSIYKYEYSFDGLFFKKIKGYKLAEEGFVKKSKSVFL